MPNCKIFGKIFTLYILFTYGGPVMSQTESKVQSNVSIHTPFFTSALSQSASTNSDAENSLIQKLKNITLNSQRINYLYGSYGVKIIYQNDNLRVTDLFSGHDNSKTMRTCAMTNYSLPVAKSLQEAHDAIFKGASIGKTLKNHGFEVIKEPLYLGIINLPKFAQTDMAVETNKATVYIYHLYAKSSTGDKVKYCTITEIYSPDYLPVSRFLALYSNEYKHHHTLGPSIKPYIDRINNLDSLLESNQRKAI